MNKKFKHACLVLTILLIIVLAINSLVYNRNSYKKGDNSSLAVVNEIREAEKSGQVVDLNSEELNNIISIVYSSDKTKGGITLKTPEGFLEEGNIGFKVPVVYKNKEFIIYIKGNVDSDENTIKFTPKTIKVGSLPLPKRMVLNTLSKYLKDDIKVQEGVIVIQKKLAPFPIEWVKIENSTLLLKINKLVPDSLLDGKESSKAELDKLKDQLKNLKEKSDNSEVKKKVDEIINNMDKSKDDSSKVIEKIKDEIKDVDKEINDTIKEIEKKNEEKKASLNQVSSQLSSAMGSAGSQKGEEIIGIMISSINKTSSDSSYDFSGDVARVKNIYSKLSSKEKNDLKKAIISNVNLSLVNNLRATFGI